VSPSAGDRARARAEERLGLGVGRQDVPPSALVAAGTGLVGFGGLVAWLGWTGATPALDRALAGLEWHFATERRKLRPAT